jgi:hypothetical protein
MGEHQPHALVARQARASETVNRAGAFSTARTKALRRALPSSPLPTECVSSLLCVVSASQAVRDGPSKSAWGKLLEIPGINSPEFGKDKANFA